MKRRNFCLLGTSGLAGLVACKRTDPSIGSDKIRFGHFPNITHVQGLVAHQLSRRNEGWFEKRLDLKVEWFTYNAGPSATEAMFAHSIDVTYIGPSPTLNAYAKSRGSEMRVLASAANGGSSLLVRADSGITKPEDFRGKKIASPQLGNTQDVQLRAWLAKHGINVTLTGGDAMVMPTENADQLSLLKSGKIDAVWTAEPWVTRLELEAGARIFYEDRDTNVTLLVARSGFVQWQPELTRKLTAAHHELTAWIQQHPDDAKALVKAELTALMKSAPSDAVIDRALSRVIITDVISRSSLDAMVASAQSVGFLKNMPALDNLLPSF